MEVKLPNLGEGADSGVVVSVLVKEGDEVTEGQTLLELENEKAVAPIPAPTTGRIRALKIREGDKLSVGQTILILETQEVSPDQGDAEREASSGTSMEREKPSESAQSPGKMQTRSPAGHSGKSAPIRTPEGPEPPASPSVRRIARHIGLDLRWVTPTGNGGRILLEDIRSFIRTLLEQATRSSQATEASNPEASRPVAKSIDFSQWGPVTKKPMSNLRQVISRRMAESAATIPHVTQFDEADISDLMALRKKLAPEYTEKGVRLTLTPILLKALVSTLQRHRDFNSSYDEAAQELVFKDYYHIGIAVDTESGLMVPVIRDVDRKNIVELARELDSIAEKTRERKVSAEEMKGGTFTVSNQGAIGGGHFTPIINKPEAAILGLGRGSVRPGYVDGKVEPRTFLPLALSYDHRVIDGGQAARFMVDFIGEISQVKESDLKPV